VRNRFGETDGGVKAAGACYLCDLRLDRGVAGEGRMKVTIDIDCTPLEARQFFGLPDVQPMQQAVLAEMEKRMLVEMDKFAPENLMHTWFATGQQGADVFARLLAGMTTTPGAAKPK